MKTAASLFLIFFLLLRAGSVGADSLELSGASTVANEIIAPLAEPFEAATGNTIKLQSIGTGKGMIALFQGKTKAAMTAESLDDALYTTRQVAKKEGIAFTVPPGLVMTRLGKNRLILIVHQDNPVVELSRTQIKDIFTGKIGNWKELGGDDRPIQPITSVVGNAIRTVIQRKVMDGEDYRTGIRETPVPGDAIPLVAKDQGGVAVVSLSGWSAHHDKTRFVKTPDYDHPLGLVTIGPPNPEIQRLIGFIQANSRI
ncbi:MAG: substrate-binding domain-containing protein [Sulfuricella sp.]|nr:substrate-binding domain-containing protein [Sulfuricella sp.]